MSKQYWHYPLPQMQIPTRKVQVLLAAFRQTTRQPLFSRFSRRRRPGALGSRRKLKPLLSEADPEFSPRYHAQQTAEAHQF